MTLTLPDPRRAVAWLLALALVLPCAALAAAALPGPALVIQKAACRGYKAGEGDTQAAKGAEANDGSAGCDRDNTLAGFLGAIDAIINPAVIAMAAIAPIACLFGAGALMFGSRRGLVVIGSALGTLVFVVSVNGIVA